MGFRAIEKNKKGFTLIELVIVVAVIGVLSGLILNAINVQGVRQKGRDTQRKAGLKQIQTALELYYTDSRTYPPTGTSYVSASSYTSPGLGATLNSSYISQLPVDPTHGTAGYSGCSDTSYGYTYRSDGSKYVLLARMEIDESAAESRCNTISSCAGWSCSCGVGTNCYAVQNPL